LHEEDSDEETNGVVKWYAGVEQEQICEGHVVGESLKKDYFGGELLHNLNPYLSPSKAASMELTFHKKNPSSKDCVDQGNLDASTHNVEPLSNEDNSYAFKSRRKRKTPIKQVVSCVVIWLIARLMGVFLFHLDLKASELSSYMKLKGPIAPVKGQKRKKIH
jgi:hypothetical protein